MALKTEGTNFPVNVYIRTERRRKNDLLFPKMFKCRKNDADLHFNVNNYTLTYVHTIANCTTTTRKFNAHTHSTLVFSFVMTAIRAFQCGIKLCGQNTEITLNLQSKLTEIQFSEFSSFLLILRCCCFTTFYTSLLQ